MDLHVNGTNSITASRRLDVANTAINFEASDVYRTRTGIHAKVVVARNTTILAWGQINIDKDEQRTRMAGKAYKGLNQTQQAGYTREDFTHDLDMFCYALWDAALDTQIPGPVAGILAENEIAFHLRPYVLQGGGTILFGSPESGKTFTALLQAVSVDAGNSMFWPTRQAKVLYVNLERSDGSLRRRLGSVNMALAEDHDRPLVMLTRRGYGFEDIKDIVKRTIERHKISFMVLDSISRAGAGNLKDDETANLIIDGLNELCESWLAIAHTPRMDKTHTFGSVHFDAGADMRVQAMSERDEESLVVSLKMVAANDVGPQPVSALKYTFDKLGLAEVSRATPRDYPELATNLPAQDQIEMYLTQVGGKAEPLHIAEETGLKIGTVRSALSRFKGKRFNSREDGTWDAVARHTE